MTGQVTLYLFLNLIMLKYASNVFQVKLDMVNIDVQQNDESTCHIFSDKKKDSVLIPCGHTFCYPCSLHFFVNKEPCPMCRKNIDKCVNPSNWIQSYLVIEVYRP